MPFEYFTSILSSILVTNVRIWCGHCQILWFVKRREGSAQNQEYLKEIALQEIELRN